MRAFVATVIVFCGGFAVMVLEIIGARLLGKDFGSSLYVWTSQIGVVMIALAIGYCLGGWLADRQGRLRGLACLVLPAAVSTFFIPEYAGVLIGWIVMRHPVDQPIPPIWEKLDPALGSAALFLVPCIGLGAICPFMIRICARDIMKVGRISGWLIAASTMGSIAGVFVSGYLLIDLFSLPTIFRGVGILSLFLSLLCIMFDPVMGSIWHSKAKADGYENR